MSEPMSEPIKVVTGDVVKPAFKLNTAISIIGIAVMVAALIMMWRADRRASKSDAGFRDSLRSFGERLSPPRTHTSTVNGQPYRVEHCGPSCAEGHTYDSDCAQRPVTSDGSAA